VLESVHKPKRSRKRDESEEAKRAREKSEEEREGDIALLFQLKEAAKRGTLSLSKREGRGRQENARRRGLSRQSEEGDGKTTDHEKRSTTSTAKVTTSTTDSSATQGGRSMRRRGGKRGTHARKSKRAKDRNRLHRLKQPSLPPVVLHLPLTVSVERRGVPVRSERAENQR
jgi:hypothetical protein